MTLAKAFKRFTKHLQYEKCCSPLTLEGYRSDFALFTGFLKSGNVPLELERITPEIVQEYLYWFSKKKYKPNSIRRRLYSLSSFFDFCVNWDLILKHPMRRLVIPKREKTPPIYLTEEELRQFLDALEKVEHTEGWLLLRNRLALYTLALTGLRSGEMLNLDWSDINFEQEIIMVRKGKGGKYRSVPMTPKLKVLLKQYWDSLKKPILHKAVFVSVEGNRLTRRTLHEVFVRCLKAANLEGRGFTPHKLRHTFATLLLQKGEALENIRELLGHEDISTTMIYAHVHQPKLRDAVRKHPLANG